MRKKSNKSMGCDGAQVKNVVKFAAQELLSVEVQLDALKRPSRAKLQGVRVLREPLGVDERENMSMTVRLGSIAIPKRLKKITPFGNIAEEE